MKSKFFYEQFNEEAKEEVKLYESHSEETKVELTKCPHKKTDVTFTEGKLLCRCGAVWFGAGLGRLYDSLSS